MPSFYRYDGSVRNPVGLAIPGASVAVLGQPATFTSQPGSPLQTLYAAASSNSGSITAAVWNGGAITFSLSMTPPSDVVAGSYIAVSGVTPSTFNTTVSAPYLVVSVTGMNVVVASPTSPGSYVSGGTIATSALPNPTATDSNGNFFFYVTAGIYSIQIYGPTITERDLLDQGVGTVAGGSVLSVGLTMPAQFAVGGSPVTTTGTLAVTWANENANLVLAGPTSGGAAAPTFRALVSADFPGGVGTVTSVAHTLAVPASILSAAVVGSPVTTSGTLADTISLATQSANTVWAGPTSGGASTPTFRALVAADIAPASPASTTQILFNSAGTISGNAALTFATATGTISATISKAGIQEFPNTLSGSTDAIIFPGGNWITTAGVDATTLATPTVTTDDGKRILVVDTGGHAHTITAAANKIVPSHHLVTFNGTAGSYVVMEAYQGLWYPLENSGVVIS